jgi:hypothetical protein
VILQEGDKVRSIQLPCLGVGTVLCGQEDEGQHAAHDPLTIITVTWEKDPHNHLPEDHSPMEDWDFSDLVKIEPCSICGPDHMGYGFHMTGEHDEQFVNNADAVDTGELVVVPASLVYGALEALKIPYTLNEFRMANVDRRIIQAIVDAIKELDPYGDQSVGIQPNWDLQGSLEELQNYLNDNPIKESV